MLSSRSKKIATATVVLFRRFTTISSWRLFPAYSAVTRRSLSVSIGRTVDNLSSFQAFQGSPKSLVLISHQSDKGKISFRRYLTSSGQNEDLGSNTKSSFSVPMMGTDDDDTIATSDHTGYEKWIRRLYATNMFHPVKLGLENMHILHGLLGSPMDDVSTKVPLPFYDCDSIFWRSVHYFSIDGTTEIHLSNILTLISSPIHYRLSRIEL
uniref:Uncharacterized protein n=1 Tax=Pseudo-nitzschia australis TaxID=44445 RepID=A0A7S4EES4_9STRA